MSNFMKDLEDLSREGYGNKKESGGQPMTVEEMIEYIEETMPGDFDIIPVFDDEPIPVTDGTEHVIIFESKLNNV
jgi:hypothetical protein